MGGRGSGRWRGYLKKDTVEDCLSLSISAFRQAGANPRNFNQGSLVWTARIPNVPPRASATFRLQPIGEKVILQLYFLLPDNKRYSPPAIELKTTDPYFGGLRWWFTCPLTANGKSCQRRVTKLYFPFGAFAFGCRNCYCLTYESAQTHDKRLKTILSDHEAMWKWTQGALEPWADWKRRQLFKAWGWLPSIRTRKKRKAGSEVR
jgi:hypothetical protein